MFGNSGMASSSCYPCPQDPFYLAVAKGNVPGHSMVQKFGSGVVTTTLSHIHTDGTYQTPETAIALEFVSDDAGDNSAGLGAREVTIIGLDANWNEVSQTIITDGLTPVQLGTDLTRLYRWWASSSGVYSQLGAQPHLGNLVVQETGGGTIWSTIENTPAAFSQSQIGFYTAPINTTAYLLSKHITVETSKIADIYFVQRCNADDVTVPFSGTRRIVEREIGLTSGFSIIYVSPKGPFVGPADLGFYGRVSVGSGIVSVEFELLVVQDGF
jgi:hypothetical protein